jgi:hypothetical protein
MANVQKVKWRYAPIALSEIYHAVFKLYNSVIKTESTNSISKIQMLKVNC